MPKDPTDRLATEFRVTDSKFRMKDIDHDFLWRSIKHLPERGRIGIFNRSYYEEVLVVRVHPELLPKQRIPERLVDKKVRPIDRPHPLTSGN